MKKRERVDENLTTSVIFVSGCSECADTEKDHECDYGCDKRLELLRRQADLTAMFIAV